MANATKKKFSKFTMNILLINEGKRIAPFVYSFKLTESQEKDFFNKINSIFKDFGELTNINNETDN